MILLLLGLILFLGAHSVRIAAEEWRRQTIARIGTMPWKGLYSVVAIAGFVLIIYGYAAARAEPVLLWSPPIAMRHIASLLNLVAVVFLVAAYVPKSGVKAKLHHPMVLAVKVWALAHLLSNGTLADVILFGSFLAWAIFDFRAARLRDQANGTVYPAGTAAGTAVTFVVGIAVWAGFAFWAHEAWIGVHPFRG